MLYIRSVYLGCMLESSAPRKKRRACVTAGLSHADRFGLFKLRGIFQAVCCIFCLYAGVLGTEKKKCACMTAGLRHARFGRFKLRGIFRLATYAVHPICISWLYVGVFVIEKSALLRWRDSVTSA